ncbi:MAG: PAS domain-containing protein [Deltaproteobacteria bacterium]|nr:PAS domain-containing protein [Deltaproteobacteria bacterium]
MKSTAQILLVDDEIIITLELKRCLTALGYEVVGTAISGEESVKMAQALHPDLVLMDIVMPGKLDGILAAEIISSQLDIPIVFVTSHAGDQFLERAKKTGAFGYILKPFQQNQIEAVIGLALHKHEMGRRLRQSETRYSLATEAGRVGMWEWKVGQEETYIDPVVKALLGYQPHEIGNTMEDWVRLIHPEDINRLRMDMQACLENAAPHFELEHRMIHKNGAIRWFLTRGSLVNDYAGRPVSLLGTQLDITDKHDIQEELRKSLEKIKLFAYSISHDLKSPALGIHGLARLLHDHYGSVLDEKGKEYCRQLMNVSRQINSFADNINAFISAKETPITIELIDIKDILMIIRSDFANSLEQRRINWSEPDTLPEIRGNKLAILRILRNLIDNAIKYGGEKLSRIDIGYDPSQTDHVFSVSNDGVNISAENAEKIFNPFQRLETSRQTDGSGLGLAIVKELVEQHHGQVWIESGQHHGVTFYFSIVREL